MIKINIEKGLLNKTLSKIKENELKVIQDASGKYYFNLAEYKFLKIAKERNRCDIHNFTYGDLSLAELEELGRQYNNGFLIPTQFSYEKTKDSRDISLEGNNIKPSKIFLHQAFRKDGLYMNVPNDQLAAELRFDMQEPYQLPKNNIQIRNAHLNNILFENGKAVSYDVIGLEMITDIEPFKYITATYSGSIPSLKVSKSISDKNNATIAYNDKESTYLYSFHLNDKEENLDSVGESIKLLKKNRKDIIDRTLLAAEKIKDVLQLNLV